MDRGTHNNICNKQEAEEEVITSQEQPGNIALDVLTDMMHRVVDDVDSAEETNQISKSIQDINLNNLAEKTVTGDISCIEGELLKVTTEDPEQDQGELLDLTTEEHNHSSTWDSSITDDEIEVICKHSSPYVVTTTDMNKIQKSDNGEEIPIGSLDIQGAVALDTSNECGEPQTQSIMYMSQQYNVPMPETPASYLGSEWGSQLYNNQVQPTHQDGSLMQHLSNGLPPQFMQQPTNQQSVNNGFQYSAQGTQANPPANNGFQYSAQGTQSNPPVNNGFQYSSQGAQGNTWATWTTPLDYNPQNPNRPQNTPQQFWSSNASFVSGNNDFQTPPPPPPPPPTFPEFHPSASNQFDFATEPSAFIYPSIYVSHAGLITVLLKDDISVEMLVDRTVRLVSHNRQMAIALSSKGNMSSIFHPILKLLQNGTAMDIDLGSVQAKITSRDIQFANEMSCFKFDYTQIEPATPNFNDLSKDSSVNLLFSSEGYGQNLVTQCLDLASKAEYENLPKGGVIVRINGVKITRRARGEVSVETGPKNIRLVPNTGICHVQTQILDVSINQDHSVSIRRDVNSLIAANGRVVLSNGCIEAGFDEHSRLKVLSLPRRSPLPVGVKRQRRPGGTAGTRRKATALGGMP
ncbi:uncharacterized protein LOC121381423 [Gigantopelta aegis]|uniref:uncharacterized protein LOC121381423 n=1 Tax=Gigantopelta aegis TaxID=1735272 RepID=UPI001B88E407|nr:uncharacterized protein LOC121381423 [Gigantopelta aegis]